MTGEGKYAPFACVRGRERVKRCERGMPGRCVGSQQLVVHPLAPLRERRGENMSIPLAPLRYAKGGEHEHPPNPLTLREGGDSSLRSE